LHSPCIFIFQREKIKEKGKFHMIRVEGKSFYNPWLWREKKRNKRKTEISDEIVPDISRYIAQPSHAFEITAAKQTVAENEDGNFLMLSAQNAGKGQFFLSIKLTGGQA
jgi:hypothetical protein